MNTDERREGIPRAPRPRSAFASLCLSVLICGSPGISGCGSAVSEGRSASLAGDDLQKVTDDIAMQLAASPAVRGEIAKQRGPLKVVVQPVINEMTGEVLPRGQAIAFTGRVRDLLFKAGNRDFVWIINRDEFHALRAKETGDLGPSPDAINPQYALQARFKTVTKDDRDHRSVYYLCVYELTDLNSRLVLWNGAYEMKKSVVKGFLD